MNNLWFNGPHNAFQYDATLADEVARDADNPIRPAYSSRAEVVPDVTPIKLGDGYAQYVRKAMDRDVRTFNLNFTKRRGPVITALGRFFTGDGAGSLYNREPNEFFYWSPATPWNPQQTTLRILVLEPYVIVPETYDSWTMQVVFTTVKTP